MRRPNQEAVLNALDRNEDVTARALMVLLRQARRELWRKLQRTPKEFAAVEVITAMRRAVDDAIARLKGRAVRTMASGRATAIQLGVQLAEAGLPQAEMLVVFALNPSTVRAVGAANAALVSGIADDLRAEINRQVQVGFLAGDTPREVRDRVLGTDIEPVGPFRTARARANAIARTELNRISNTATWERAKDAATRHEDLKKRWLSARDVRVRPSHAAANGQVVGILEDFTVGGYACSHPLDPRLPAAEAVHCRCRAVIVVPEVEG